MTETEFNTCNYCPNTKHLLCTHKQQCLLSDERMKREKEIIRLNKELEGEDDEYIIYRNQRRIMELKREIRELRTNQGGF